MVDYHHLPDSVMVRNYCLNLSRFYPEPPDLYLVVCSPQEFDIAIR